MCNTNRFTSLKERVQSYITREQEIKDDYKNRMNALNEVVRADILANCPIKVGDVYLTDVTGAWGVKHQYYKVAKLDTDVRGTVTVYGYKRKLDKSWGKRDNNYMFVASIYSNYDTGNYAKIENYVEPSKD